MDKEQDWKTVLSLREQQLLSFADILLNAPRFVFLDRVGEELGSGEIANLLRMLSENSIGYANSGENLDARDLYDAVLACGDDGDWTWTSRPG